MSLSDSPGSDVIVCICVRQTLDWTSKAAVDAGLIEVFRPMVEMWDASFNVPYHEFRQRLKVIAQLSLSRVEGVQQASLERAPPGALLVPVDDDDWFSPDLAQRLRQVFDPSIPCYYWSRHILEPDRSKRRWKGLLKELLTGRVIFATNNYALRNLPGLVDVRVHHMVARDHFQATQVRYLPAALSVHNRSLASRTVLAMKRPTVLGMTRPIPRDQLVDRFECYRRLYGRTHLSRGLRWAAPYVAMMSELMQSLKLR
jgi:hypothetical protein